MRNKISNAIWGLIFIIAGLGIAGDVLNLWEFTPFFPGWWTLFIIIPCGISLIRDGINVGSIVGLFIGFTLLASQYVDFNFDIWKLIVPGILVLIGLRILFQGAFRPRIHMSNQFNDSGNTSYSSANRREYSAVFASNNVHVTDEFLGTNLNAVFGGIVLDLRDAVIQSDVEINASAIFGGIDLYLPRGVNIKINNVPIFGGVSNKVGKQAEPGAPTIYLNSTCMFGGIDIK